RVLRDRLYSTLPNGIGGVTAAAGPGDEVGGTFDVEITLPGPEEVAGWLAEHAAGEGRTGVAGSGTSGRGTGTLTGPAPTSTRPRSPRTTSGRWRPGWPTPPGPRRCTMPRARSTPWPPMAWSWPG